MTEIARRFSMLPGGDLRRRYEDRRRWAAAVDRLTAAIEAVGAAAAAAAPAIEQFGRALQRALVEE